MKDRSRDHDIEAYTRFVEDYARELDKSGWMIVPQPDMAKYGPWVMDSKFGPVPWWAKDTAKAVTAKAVTAGDRRRQAMSGDSGESVKSVKSVI
jgi:hypothetical protein